MLYLNLDKEANMKNKNYFILINTQRLCFYYLEISKGEEYEYEENLINWRCGSMKFIQRVFKVKHSAEKMLDELK